MVKRKRIRERNSYLIQTVCHGLDVLSKLAESDGEVGVTQLSETLNLHKNNVFRLLATLEFKGFVVQNPETEGYKLGPVCSYIGQGFNRQSNIVTMATPVIRDLRDKIGETVSLAILVQDNILYPVSFESQKPVRVSGRRRVLIPAKTNVSGRLLIAHLDGDSFANMVNGDSPSDVAITSQSAELKASGVIVDRGGLEADVAAVSKVVLNAKGQAVGAVEVLAPLFRTRVDEILSELEVAVASLTRQIGCASPLRLSEQIELFVTESLKSPKRRRGVLPAETVTADRA